MQEDEDYELVPAKRVQELQEQLDALKRNPLGSMQSGTDMISSMNKLSRSMDEMLSLFRDAAMQMQAEEKESPASGRKLEPMMEKLDAIIDQNHKIAKGILALADMIKEQSRHQKHPFQQPPPRISMYPNPPAQSRAEDIFGMPQQGMMPSASMPPPSGPLFPPSSGMMMGPPRPLPPAPSPPGFMNKKREAPF